LDIGGSPNWGRASRAYFMGREFCIGLRVHSGVGAVCDLNLGEYIDIIASGEVIGMVAFGRILVLVVTFGSLGGGVCFGKITQEKLILGDFIDAGCIVAATFKEVIL
jgi:hypothetical protein